MKKILLLAVFSLLSLAFHAQAIKELKKNITTVRISRVNWNMTTDVAINGVSFDSQNFPVYKTTDKKTIREILKCLSDLNKPYDLTNPDFRCKCYFFSGDTLISSACITREYTLYDGVFYETPVKLINLIENIKDEDTEFHPSSVKIEDYPGGMKSLYSFIYEELGNLSISELSHNTIVFIIVHIDGKGKTKRAEYINKSDSDLPDSLKDKLDNIFYDKIKWTKDPNRGNNYKITLKINIPIQVSQVPLGFAASLVEELVRSEQSS